MSDYDRLSFCILALHRVGFLLLINILRVGFLLLINILRPVIHGGYVRAPFGGKSALHCVCVCLSVCRPDMTAVDWTKKTSISSVCAFQARL